jgi:aspartyl-tRNA(Asn)/glutamyl-tRNA(Gln) amidotransferase subunit A
MAEPQAVTEDTVFLPLRDLAARIHAGRLSPVALAEACLDRLEKLGAKYNAVVTVTRERALREAAVAEKEVKAGKIRGPLHGIPYGVKDLLATKDIATTWGAQPYREQVFDYEATAIRKLREAGAVLVAKLAMVELAGGFGYNNADASFTGPGLTPWNIDYWSGGSSSGPGSAVAAGLVPFAIGSETSGSIITPSAYCGVSGLRPTFGRISRHGAMALSWTLDKLGPMARTADDCGLVLAGLAGADPLDPACADRPFAYTTPEKPEKRFRLGIVKGCTEGVQPDVRKNFEASVKVLREFADVDEAVALPDLPFGPTVGVIIDAEAASAFQDLLESGKSKDLQALNDRWGGYSGMAVLAVDYLRALRVTTVMKREMDKVYAGYDALIAPSRDTVAYPINVDFDQAYPGVGSGLPLIPAGNLVGQPALSVPNGFGPNGLPTGIQFTGRVWSEAKLIAVAHAYQQATDWHKKRPPAEGKP